MLHYIKLFLFVMFMFVAVSCQAAKPVFECQDAIGCVTIKPNEPIKIGVIQDMSAGVAFVGLEQVNMVELAVSDHEAQLLGHPIVLQQEDDKCSPEGGANAMLRIIADPQMMGVIGSTCSGAAVPAAKIMSQAGLVMISGANTAPDLTVLGKEKGENWQAGYFRTVSNGQGVASTAAIFAFEKLGLKKAATLNSGDNYTAGYAKVFAQTFTELGGEIVLEAVVYRGDTDMKPVLQGVVKSKAELLFSPLNIPEANYIVTQAKDVAGLEEVTLITSLNVTDEFVESIGDTGIGMYFSYQSFLKNPEIDLINSKYQTKFNKIPVTANAPFAYDATQLLLKTIEQIASQEADGTLHVGRQALREALYATKDFAGISGKLTCTPLGDCTVGKFDVMRLTDPTQKAEGVRKNVVYTHEGTN